MKTTITLKDVQVSMLKAGIAYGKNVTRTEEEKKEKVADFNLSSAVKVTTYEEACALLLARIEKHIADGTIPAEIEDGSNKIFNAFGKVYNTLETDAERNSFIAEVAEESMVGDKDHDQFTTLMFDEITKIINA